VHNRTLVREVLVKKTLDNDLKKVVRLKLATQQSSRRSVALSLAVLLLMALSEGPTSQ
jgi:hypothetical protein